MVEALTWEAVADGDPKAWCVVLHGLGDSMQGWMDVVPLLGLRGLGYIFVNAPRPYGPGFSWFPIPGLTHAEVGPDEFEEAVQDSRERLRATIDVACTEVDCDPAHLFLMGFSQGCMMVTDHAWRSDRRYAGVVGISGRILDVMAYPDAFGAAGPEQDVLLTHGRQDEMLDVRDTDEQRQVMQQHGARIDWRVYDKGHTLAQDEAIDIARWISERQQRL